MKNNSTALILMTCQLDILYSDWFNCLNNKSINIIANNYLAGFFTFFTEWLMMDKSINVYFRLITMLIVKNR